MAERTIHWLVLFINFENITDVRQTRFGSMLSPPDNTPRFTEVWAPLDGFVANAGVKVQL
jgi:iron complex outermembrane receptor protein